MTNKKETDVLSFLAGKPKPSSKNKNEMSIEDAIDINKDKFFEVERQQNNKPAISFSESTSEKSVVKVLGTIPADDTTKKRLIRIPNTVDQELVDFCGKESLGKEYVALAYYAMKILKSENKSITAIFND